MLIFLLNQSKTRLKQKSIKNSHCNIDHKKKCYHKQKLKR